MVALPVWTAGPAGGQVRCRPEAPGWGGGLVVVAGVTTRRRRPGEPAAGRRRPASRAACAAGRSGGMSAVNTDELAQAVREAERRVLKIQTKLHRWARDDPHRRFDDLFNLVADPGFLLVGWNRVRGNKGARTAGIDGRTARSVVAEQGVEEFLDQLRLALRERSFRPVPVRERMIPKVGGKLRRLGIPTVAD